MDILPLSLLGFGFLVGVKHAFDVDHIAAVSTILSDFKSIKKCSLLGIFWGFGHMIAIFAVSLVILFLNRKISEKFTLSLEIITGIMLLILGLNVLVTIDKNKIHMHKHRHNNEEHIHLHSHKIVKSHVHKHLPLNKSLIIGLIHGLAGSAFVSLLVLTTVNSIFLGLIYILIFGIGSIIGMLLITTIISLPFTLLPDKLVKTQKILRVSTGFVSMVIGLVILYEIISTKDLL